MIKEHCKGLPLMIINICEPLSSALHQLAFHTNYSTPLHLLWEVLQGWLNSWLAMEKTIDQSEDKPHASPIFQDQSEPQHNAAQWEPGQGPPSSCHGGEAGRSDMLQFTLLIRRSRLSWWAFSATLFKFMLLVLLGKLGTQLKAGMDRPI